MNPNIDYQLPLNKFNEAWLKGVAQSKYSQDKEKRHDCPHPYYDFDATRGTTESVKVECMVGVGKWCKICPHYKKALYQQRFNKGMYEAHKKRMLDSYFKTGLAPHLRKKSIPKMIVDPFGFRGK